VFGGNLPGLDSGDNSQLFARISNQANLWVGNIIVQPLLFWYCYRFTLQKY
jgi:hypothetical protein